MEVFRFILGISTPLISIGLKHRKPPHPLPVHIATVSHSASPTDGAVESAGNVREREGNWVMKILRVGSFWEELKEGSGGDDDEIEDEDDGCSVEEAVNRVDLDRDSFSRFLSRVSLPEAEIYVKLSYLSKLAYAITKIKKNSLLKYHGLHFVTSSLETKAFSSNAEDSTPRDENGSGISEYVAFRVVASAASYLQSQTRSILPLGMDKAKSLEDPSINMCSNEDEVVVTKSQVASFIATTNSVTAVISGEEAMKDAVAEDLNSAHYPPCEWYICDDEKTDTRYFVIQGSESLESWQANLLFEPIEFEGLDVLVHRGIYEAAKGIYQPMLAEVQAYLKNKGKSATFRFTGHSLGGSLALLVNFMLLVRGDAPHSSLLPVVTFGAPFIMCGGDSLLRKLGLPHSHVQSIMMHRDIVPRAFSCHYPDQVAKILKAVNRNFRNHPCLKNQNLLYTPMGDLLILQPDEKYSPHHDLLPPGTGLYFMGHYSSEVTEASMKLLNSARSVFLNSPHPLEVLSDRSAYGSEGTIFRDHDINAYLRSILVILRKELKNIRKSKREQERLKWWPLLPAQAVLSAFIIDHSIKKSNVNRH
ncbi:hypothetical protein KSP40_PGU008076 [Platanthera guangdongensis]|uniref:Fungal lipase-type domain-containing protein n=1 Tax=Platanthera guangdongensis TaxID=2320717 RepID=A0ABR2M970_9ASPA